MEIYIEYNKLHLPFHLASELSRELESRERKVCRYQYKKAGNTFSSAFPWICLGLFWGCGGISLVVCWLVLGLVVFLQGLLVCFFSAHS